MRKIILFLFLFLNTLAIKSQTKNTLEAEIHKDTLPQTAQMMSQTGNLTDLNIPRVVTPEVASMIKYIDHPVDFCTGFVNIQIPIYELVEGDIKIPISISYATTGLKVKEANGRLGMGWTLHAEPSVSRQINGLPDERGYLVTRGKGTGYTHYFGYMAELTDGVNDKDEDPDTFYYKLLNKSGKFYFNRGDDLDKPSSTVTIETVPFEPLKITYTRNYNSLNNFEITDDNGFVYRFGGTNAIGRAGIDDINWKATEIISSVNNKVSFAYGTYNTTYTWGLTDHVVVEEAAEQHPYYDAGYYVGCSNAKWPFITRKTTNSMSQINNINIDSYYEGSTLKYRGTIGQSLSSCYQLNYYPEPGGNVALQEAPLKTMETSSIKIEFIGSYFLERINIIDKATNTIIRSARFYSTYFNSQDANGSTKRKLDRLEITDRNGVVVEKYSFTYYSPSSVPNLLNKNVDHWGYYNGTSLANSQSAVPQQQITGNFYISGHTRATFNITIGEANKRPSLNYTRIGALQSITYPTGRQSTFTYELNRYKEYTGIETAGGLRIAEIKEYDPVSAKTLIRKFEYGENGDGAGTLRHKVTLDNYKYDKIISHGSSMTSPGKLALATIYVSTPFTGLFYGGGSPVYYQYVTETKYVSNTPVSKTAYKYTHPNSFIACTPNTTLVFESGSPWSGGYPEKITNYKVDNDTYFKPVKTVSYQYRTYKSSTLKYGKAYRRIIFKPGNPNDGRWDGTQAEQNRGFTHQRQSHSLGCLRLISEKTETYTYGIPSVNQEKTYTYNNLNHMYATEIKEYNSDGVQTTVTLKYPQDLSFTANSDEETGRTDLITKNRLNTPLQETILTGAKLWTNKLKYTKDPTSGITLPKSINSGKGSSLEERTVINRYYNFGKPAQITVDGNLSTVFIWSYNKQYLIAEIQNATFAQLTAAISEASLNTIAAKAVPTIADFTLINNLRTNTNLKDAHISTYTYKPSYGILTVTDPSGKITYYDYDDAGRLKETYIMENSTKKVIQSYNYHYRNQ